MKKVFYIFSIFMFSILFCSCEILQNLGYGPMDDGHEIGSPKDIPGLYLWLDSDEGVSGQDCASSFLKISNGNPLLCWYDQSGNNFNAGLGVGPVNYFQNSSFFDGRSRIYMFGNSNLSITGANVGSPNTIFVVVHLGYSSVAAESIFKVIDGNPMIDFFADFGKLGIAWNNNTEIIVSDKSMMQPVILENVSSGQSHSFYINGALIGSKFAIITPSSTISIGNAMNFERNFAAVIIYNRNLDDLERKEVESYLSKRYGIDSDL